MSTASGLENETTSSAKKWERSLSIRITALLVIATFLLIGQSAYNLSSIKAVDDSIDIVNKATFDLDNLSRNIRTPIADIRILSMEMVSAPNRERLDETKKRFDDTVETVENNLLAWKTLLERSTAITKERRDALSNILRSWEDYMDAVAKTFFYIDTGVRVAAFISVTQQEKESYDRLQESLDLFSRILVERSEEVFVSTHEQSNFAFYSLIVTSVIQVLILFVTLVFVYRMIKTYMNASQTYEREIEAKEALLRMALDNMPGAMIVVDENLRVVLVNEQYKHFYSDSDGLAAPGGSMQEILTKEIEHGLINGEGAPEDILQERLASLTSGETLIKRDTGVDGQTLQLTRKPAPGGYTVAVSTDITDVVEAQRGAKLLQEALDTFSDMVILYDNEERVIFTNDRYHEIYPASPPKDEITSYTMEDLLRRSLKSGLIDHPLAKSDPEAWLQQALSDRRNMEAFSGETTHKSGRTYFFRKNWTTEGGMIIVQTDITERKQAEREIERQRATLDNILSNISQGVVLYDSDKRLVACNPAYPDVLGFDKSFFEPGRQLFEVAMASAERGDYGEGDPETLAHERVEVLWQTLRRPDISFNDERSFDVQTTRTADGGLIIAYTDITERKKATRIIADAMHLINESIQYAGRIQRSLLPDPKVLGDVFADHVVIWEPKDMVGGDVYLYRKCDGGHLLVLIDCTGHGVPGAFMTMIATGAIDQALIENPSGDPAAILARANQLVKRVLGQDTQQGESDDGFECGICLIDETARTLSYAGARFELWCLDGDRITAVKGNKVGIGYRRTDIACVFDSHILPIGADASYYMTSDGLIDQIGGDKRRSFGKRRLKTLILDYSKMKMAHQGVHIHRAFEEYQHDEVRRDDISLVGFRVKT